jgi:hypothetical protein
MLENYIHKYQARGKYIFTPNEACKAKGDRLLRFFKNHEFPDYFFHYKTGGHVAALHSHLQNNFFFKIDLQNFFYSVSRNRVAEALRAFGFHPARTFAKWSSVRNPYSDGPAYVLPIGFVQSPLLASLVLLRSPVAAAIERARDKAVNITVYFDDFIGSGLSVDAVTPAYEEMLSSFKEANLKPSPYKLAPPAAAVKAFNCDLSRGRVEVTPERIDRFFSEARSLASAAAFEQYRARVASLNLA